MQYPAQLSYDDDGIIVTFRDLENVFSWGETEEEAIKNAREAKEGILEYMDEHGIPYFLPSEPKEGEILI